MDIIRYLLMNIYLIKIEYFFSLSRDSVLGSSQQLLFWSFLYPRIMIRLCKKNVLGLEEQYSSFRFMKLEL
jgi:hypothetical protein